MISIFQPIRTALSWYMALNNISAYHNPCACFWVMGNWMLINLRLYQQNIDKWLSWPVGTEQHTLVVTVHRIKSQLGILHKGEKQGIDQQNFY